MEKYICKLSSLGIFFVSFTFFSFFCVFFSIRQILWRRVRFMLCSRYEVLTPDRLFGLHLNSRIARFLISFMFLKLNNSWFYFIFKWKTVQFHIIELISNDFELTSWTIQITFSLQAKKNKAKFLHPSSFYLNLSLISGCLRSRL